MGQQGIETVLETGRLLLRPWRLEEAAVQRELWTERDPRVPAHRRIGADGRPSVGDLEERIRRSAEIPGLGLLALERKVERDVIGYCGLVEGGPGSVAEGADRPGPEIAFELLRRAQGAGYATEAGQAVLHGAREAGNERVRATVWAWNGPSRRVLEKLGFVETDRTGSTVDEKADGPGLPDGCDGCDGDMLLFVRTFRPA